MKLTIEQGEIALPDDFSFEIESRHPFFSDEGTASIPVTLPASPGNLKFFGNPENIRNRKRHVREFEALLQSGVFRKKCLLISESAGLASGISASLAFMESEIYEGLQDKKLRDIFAARSFFMTKMYPITPFDVYKGRAIGSGILEDIAIFPVATDKESSGKVSVINEPLQDSLRDNARTVTVNGNTFAAPAGYGVSPFLYLWALAEYAFTLSGYKVGMNVLKTDKVLKEIVVVNNCADTCCSYGYDTVNFWGFNYSDLVPDITIGEMIVFLHDTFGAYVTHDSGNVDIRLFRDDVSADADADLSGYAREDLSVTYPEPRILERSMDTSIESASPAADTLENLRASHETLSRVNSESEISGTGLFYVRALGKYYYKQSSASTPDLLGSDCFTYIRKLDMERESISSKASFLPMRYTGSRYMPYIGNRIHKYIDVDGKDKDADQPILLCYAHLYKPDASAADKQHCGSSYSYREDGTSVYYLPASDNRPVRQLYPSLTPEGLARYWSGYEKLLNNSAPEIEVTLDIPFERLSLLNRLTPKLFNGAVVMIKSMSYSISDTGISGIDTVLQLLPAYSDMVVLPAIEFGTAYGWVLVNTRTIFSGNGYEILSTDGLQDYSSEDAPEELPSAAGTITKRRSRWLEYKYTEKKAGWFGWTVSSHTGTHRWEEYFIAEAQGA